jgi:outer membrane protein OmpA-like peptidoglycan-associated protein
MNKLQTGLAIALALGSGAIGCATTQPLPPPELTAAREEVGKAQQGPAASIDPTDVHDATVALDRAEKSFADDPHSANTVDLAVTARLKAEAAQARTDTVQANNNKSAVDRQYEGVQAQRIQEQQQDIAMEQKQRVDLEQKLLAARAALGGVATNVKTEPRGTIVTFETDPLFDFAKSELKPTAKEKLDMVAEQLQQGFAEHKIHVIGHTDNVGGAGKGNQALSESRAGAVKDYLVTKGIKSSLIDSSGRGPTEPIANNATDEGRKLNRRVEIIIEPAVSK